MMTIKIHLKMNRKNITPLIIFTHGKPQNRNIAAEFRAKLGCTVDVLNRLNETSTAQFVKQQMPFSTNRDISLSKPYPL